MRIEWDEAKAKTNRLKHDLTFAEAAQLFRAGGDYLEIYDDQHSEEEERFIAIGPIARGIIVVIWTERTEDTIRIISARFATRKEQRLFRIYLAGNE